MSQQEPSKPREFWINSCYACGAGAAAEAERRKNKQSRDNECPVQPRERSLQWRIVEAIGIWLIILAALFFFFAMAFGSTANAYPGSPQASVAIPVTDWTITTKKIKGVKYQCAERVVGEQIESKCLPVRAQQIATSECVAYKVGVNGVVDTHAAVKNGVFTVPVTGTYAIGYTKKLKAGATIKNATWVARDTCRGSL